MKQIRLSEFPFNESSYVDGPGERVVVFTQGCPIICKGCQSPGLWNVKAGNLWDVTDVAKKMVEVAREHGHTNFTISGGEPLFQPFAAGFLAKELNYLTNGAAHIILYTGHIWEDLVYDLEHPAQEHFSYIIQNVDIVVDGPFIQDLDNDFLAYRGSSNQRPINAQATILQGELVVEDWDNEVQITSDGDLVMPIGFAEIFGDMGDQEDSRICGQNEISVPQA